jgi:dienelactone hydrolase
MVLNTAMGLDVKGVSFMATSWALINKKLLKPKFSLSWRSRSFNAATEVATFKQQMDSAGIPYTFKEYPDAVHAFTNPNATAMGEKFNIPIKYNAAADSASWKDMKDFFTSLFQQQ